jgi:predicted dehydrogenase
MPELSARAPGSPPLRAVVIGLGVGARHAEGYVAHPDVELVGVCDLDAAKREEAAGRWPDARVVAEAAELLEAPDVDIASIASYDDAHHTQVKLALEHGKHVFCEKPLCLYEDEARELRTVARVRPELRLSTNVPLRRSPRFELLRRMIADGELGELFHLEGDYEYGRRHKLTDGWRGDLPYYSVVLGGAIHMVDLLLWLSGDRAVEATALGSGIATRDSKFRHDDFVVSLLRLQSGATAKVTANLGCVGPHFHAVRVYGTDATFVNGLPDALLHRTASPPAAATTETIDAAYPGVGKGALVGEFVDAVLGRGEPAVATDEAFATLAVCFAIERAAREGGTVAVADL